ncbi:MAG: hypothetical protein ABW185_10525 [Sedimenticola sp.]
MNSHTHAMKAAIPHPPRSIPENSHTHTGEQPYTCDENCNFSPTSLLIYILVNSHTPMNAAIPHQRLISPVPRSILEISHTHAMKFITVSSPQIDTGEQP